MSIFFWKEGLALLKCEYGATLCIYLPSQSKFNRAATLKWSCSSKKEKIQKHTQKGILATCHLLHFKFYYSKGLNAKL